MSQPPRILAFAGSTRRDSYNKKLVRIAAASAESAGAKVTVVDLAEYRLPLFDQDLEAAEGKPERARELKRLMTEHEGFLIACPEYNSSITAVLKNTIDWVSRPDEGDAGPMPAFRGKVVSLMASSPGALGGLRGLVHVRVILGNLGCLVLPDQVAVPKAHGAFGEDGRLADEKQHTRVEALGRVLAETLAKLRG